MMNKEYKHGWHLLMEYDEFPKGLDEDIVRALSAKKEEPEWLLDFRLRAYRKWLTMEEPDWSDNRLASKRSLLPNCSGGCCTWCGSRGLQTCSEHVRAVAGVNMQLCSLLPM